MTSPIPALPVPRSLRAPGSVDPVAADVLRSASRAFSADADEVRAVAAVVALAAALDWRGSAAGGFRAVVAERTGSIRRAAVLVDDLAAALRAGATGAAG
ncbi:MAG: hypothetical protein ACFCVG_12730 [Kineosporiaceae bacterium]